MTQDERAGPDEYGNGANSGRDEAGIDSGAGPGGPATHSGPISRYILIYAVICLVGLAAVEVLGLSSPELRAALILGLVASGTAAILVDAQRRCPGCGALCGYHLRIVNADKCRACGAAFGNTKQ